MEPRDCGWSWLRPGETAEACSIAFPGALAGSCMGTGAAETSTGAPMGCSGRWPHQPPWNGVFDTLSGDCCPYKKRDFWKNQRKLSRINSAFPPTLKKSVQDGRVRPAPCFALGPRELRDWTCEVLLRPLTWDSSSKDAQRIPQPGAPGAAPPDSHQQRAPVCCVLGRSLHLRAGRGAWRR